MAAIHAFLVHSFFGRVKNFLGLFLLRLLHLWATYQNKLQNKCKIPQIFFSVKWISLKNFTQQSRLVNIGPGYCFYVTLAEFEHKIKIDFIQMGAEYKFGIIFVYFFKRLY